MKDTVTFALANAARRLLSLGLQSWGQSDDERIKAWQQAIEAAGRKSRIGITSGRIVAVGPDSDRVQGFINEVSRNWFKGRFEDEMAYIAERLVLLSAPGEGT